MSPPTTGSSTSSGSRRISSRSNWRRKSFSSLKRSSSRDSLKLSPSEDDLKSPLFHVDHFCTLDIGHEIQQYLRFGWLYLKQKYMYSSYKVGKEHSSLSVFNRGARNALKLMGAVREHLVEDAYICVTEIDHVAEQNKYVSYGSTDITSDYDITIYGPQAADIMKDMFSNFIRKHQLSMSHAFDTNLYCNGYYYGIPQHVLKQYPNNILSAKEYIAFHPHTPEEQEMCITFALLRWPLESIPEKWRAYVQHTKTELDNLRLETDDMDSLTEKNANYPYAVDFSNEMDLVITSVKSPSLDDDVHSLSLEAQIEEEEIRFRYAFMYEFSKHLYEILYAEHSPNNPAIDIFRWMCRACYFAMEAYHTPCSINVVVLEMQAKLIQKLKPIHYICSVLENAGFLFEHVGHASDLRPILKYMYRVAYALHQLGKDKDKTLKKLQNYYSYKQHGSDLRKVLPYLDKNTPWKEETYLKQVYLPKLKDIVSALLSSYKL